MSTDKDEVLDSPTGWVAEHVRKYIETDGRVGHVYQGWTSLLLTTRGRKSGQPRRTALIYAKDGDRYLIVGSNGGSPTHPAWYLNMLDYPEVDVQVAADKFRARARAATPEERPALWKIAASAFPQYDKYQAQTDREIPVVILERVDP
ncbi:nitroreductase family deazaflavin-dependent oxidoreductase [Rhizohabitans arisaemae]|uniref:nitroreductase family deazaflavin-dependent oxidoreductase n=1 Tax=Rhizohabitans arisaemae TaxID=2720610 RepID=UPI0024B1C827|nr:nitroreductase family deazaflavin-dependent oxidoreductase [Rhizohabitans arisaemae]